MNRMLTVATARSWSRAQRKMPMPMAGSKMCSLLAISGRPSRATSPPPFSAGTGSRLPSTAVSDEPDVESPELPPASSGRSGRRSGLVSVGLSTGILSLEGSHEPVEVPFRKHVKVRQLQLQLRFDSENPGRGWSRHPGFVYRGRVCRGRPIAGTSKCVASGSSAGLSHCRHRLA